MKFRFTVPRIEIEFEANSLEQAYEMVDNDRIGILGEMHETQDLYQIDQNEVIHSLLVRENQFNNLDPLHRQWWCSCGKIIHTESEAIQHGFIII